jgi:hypothetical protein
LGEVRGWDLHFIDLVKVRLCSIKRIVPDRASDIVVLSFRSDRYSRNERASNWKAMLLNKVVVGKGMKLTKDDPALTRPLPGYDSVSVFGLFPTWMLIRS